MILSTLRTLGRTRPSTLARKYTSRQTGVTAFSSTATVPSLLFSSSSLLPWGSRSGSAIAYDYVKKRSFTSSNAAELIKELRNTSGAPIVDCKKALAETNNDLEQAVNWLRQHGTAKATQKLSGRQAEEGIVACSVASDNKSASIVKISSETDFAGKSDTFIHLAIHVAEATLNDNTSSTSQGESSNSLDIESVMNLEYESKSVKTVLEDAIVAIRENIGISEAIKMTTKKDNGMIVAYVHGKTNANMNAGSSAAIVKIVGDSVIKNPKQAEEAGKKLAMHIVAAKPLYLNPEDVPGDIIEKEKLILQSQIADSNKPPDVVEKIINGRMKKFYSEVCLTEQEHMVIEGNPKVGKALKEQDGLSVESFLLLSI